MSKFSDTEYDWEYKSIPAGVKSWSLAYGGMLINAQGRFMRHPEGEAGNSTYLSETDATALTASANNSNILIVDETWQPRSLIVAADEARDAADYSPNGINWWDMVNYPNAAEVSIPILIDEARKIILERMEYLTSGDFGSTIDVLGEDWEELSAQILPLEGIPGVVPPTVDIASQVHDDVSLGSTLAYGPLPLGTVWNPGTAETTIWNNEEVLDAMREFAVYMLDEGEVDDLVARYRLGLEIDYEYRTQRNAAMLHFAGASSTSPAALHSYRLSSEIERMVAGYRADLIRLLLPDSTSIASVFHAFVEDAARIDRFNLEKSAQTLTGLTNQIDLALKAAITDASNATAIANAKISGAVGVGDIEARIMTQEIVARVQMAISALDIRTRIAGLTESLRMDLLRVMIGLDSGLAELSLKQADAARMARQESQVNKMKSKMWKMEIASELMNAATIPIGGIPMAPPDPSKFETRLTAALSTGTNIATSLAPFGNPVLSIGAGVAGALITGLLPSFSD